VFAADPGVPRGIPLEKSTGYVDGASYFESAPKQVHWNRCGLSWLEMRISAQSYTPQAARRMRPCQVFCSHRTKLEKHAREKTIPNMKVLSI